MADLELTLDLVQFVEERAGEVSTGASSLRDLILTHMNRCLRKIYSGGQELNPDLKNPAILPWMRSKFNKVIILEPSITTGTVTVTQNSTSITFSDAPASSVKDWYFKTDDDRTTYRIASHTGGSTSATLDSVYVSDDNTAAKYKLVKLVYDAGNDVLRPFAPMQVYKNQVGQDSRYEIDPADPPTMDRRWPVTLIMDYATGDMPTRVAIISDDGEGTFTFRFNSYVNQSERVEFPYIPMPTLMSLSPVVNPPLPKGHRDLLAQYALGEILTDVDDDRARIHKANAVSGYIAMLHESEGFVLANAPNFGRILPRLDHVGRLGLDDVVRTVDGFLMDR